MLPGARRSGKHFRGRALPRRSAPHAVCACSPAPVASGSRVLWPWGLPMPHPVLPIFLPVGAHASAEALAQALQPRLPIRATQQRDGAAAVLLASDGRSALVVSSRTPTLGWKGARRRDVDGHPTFSRTPVDLHVDRGRQQRVPLHRDQRHGHGRRGAYRACLHGCTREALPITDGAFLWFDNRPPTLPSMANVTSREQAVETITVWRSSADGRLPAEIHAWSSSGALLDRIAIGARWVPIELLGAR